MINKVFSISALLIVPVFFYLYISNYIKINNLIIAIMILILLAGIFLLVKIKKKKNVVNEKLEEEK